MKRMLFFVGIVMIVIVNANAQTYSFKVEKTGKGAPMLLIPGLACAGEVWDETVSEFKKGYEKHVVTLPGFAGQPAVETDAFLKTIGDELIAYLKEEKLKETVIIGHSLGGFLSMYIGSQVPDLVSKLVVVDGLPFLGALQNPAATPESVKEMATMMRKNMELQTKEQYEAMQPMMLKTMINSDEDIEKVMEWGRNSDSNTVAQAMYELYQVDLREEIAKINVPVLVMGAWIGYKDYGATRESTQKLYELQFQKLKNYQLELTDKGKHFIMLDDPDFFFSLTRDFLSKKN